jgi:hypothetical protein
MDEVEVADLVDGVPVGLADRARGAGSSGNPMQARVPLLGLNELLDRHRHFSTLQAVASLKDNRC